MTLPSGTHNTYDAVGQRESLSNEIHMISPTETPFQMMVPHPKGKAVREEWQTDALAAAASNAQLEGDTASIDAPTPTVRLSNIMQISRKVPAVDGTLEEVVKAGRASEMAYQITKRLKELKRDKELILTGNQASVAGDASTARKLGSLRAWMTTNVNKDAGGSNGGFSGGTVSAATNSATVRALEQEMVLALSQQIYDAGGNPTVMMTGTFNKRKVSGFTGYATATRTAESKKLVASIAIFETDFHVLRVMPNRFQPGRNVYLLDLDYWSIPELRPTFMKPLAETGDSESKLIINEYTLESKNEAASGCIADLTTS